MKIETVKIGSKIGTEHVQVECKLRMPENVAEMSELARGSSDFVIQMFNRGWRIWNQEQSGARDAVAESTAAERKDMPAFTAKIQGIVDNADPTAPAKRTGRPAGPREVKVSQNDLAAAFAKNDMASLAALLAAQGVKLNIAE
jgi:hypothetical protein